MNSQQCGAPKGIAVVIGERRGVFVTLEGPEGSGKSTQAALLTAQLEEMSYEVVCGREPGGTPTGEQIRGILQHDLAGEPLANHTEALLFAASRAQLVRSVIVPALERGACVVSDRYIDSTIAYQGYGRELGPEVILAINSFATGGLLPALTILLDIDLALGFERLEQRNNKLGESRDRIEREPLAFHQRVRAGYLELAARWPERITVIDGSDTEQNVQGRIWTLVEERLRNED